MTRHKVHHVLSIAFALSLGALFVAKFAGPQILRLYVQSGIGNGQKLPIFYTSPEREAIKAEVDETYLAELKFYKFPDFNVSLPKDLKAVAGRITKTYYKKRPWRSGKKAYLLYEAPDFFVNLFNPVIKFGIKDDQEFLDRTMYARVDTINNLNDAFFTIMKSIFVPDMGDQQNFKIIKFSIEDKKGFISYDLSEQGNYFDCNLFDGDRNFYKVYIKDNNRSLDVNKMMTIVSTLRKAE